MEPQAYIDATRQWLSSMVIDLNLCPFARRVFQAELIRYEVTLAEDEPALVKALAGELEFLASTPVERVETTLLIHPRVFGDFLDYNDFLDVAERLVKGRGL